jgi:hypothetical protein
MFEDPELLRFASAGTLGVWNNNKADQFAINLRDLHRESTGRRCPMPGGWAEDSQTWAQAPAPAALGLEGLRESEALLLPFLGAETHDQQ